MTLSQGKATFRVTFESLSQEGQKSLLSHFWGHFNHLGVQGVLRGTPACCFWGFPRLGIWPTQEPPPSPFWQLTPSMVWVLPGRVSFSLQIYITVLLNSGGSNSRWSEFLVRVSSFYGDGDGSLRADFRLQGMRTATFQFSESGGSVNGPDLFTELPFL